MKETTGIKHWIQKGRPSLFLAPMEGVTDGVMRAFMAQSLPFTHLVTEFLRVSLNVPQARVFHRHMPEIKNGSMTQEQIPVLLQLLGGDPDRLAETAALAIRTGAMGIDLNFGCPAPTVNRHDGGATLLKFPDRLYQIVKAVRQVVPAHLPVSAKIRLGFDSVEPVNHNAEQIFKAGASWLTIHARTKTQGYRPPVFWQKIAEVQKNAPIPVIANGDIWSLEDFLKCREITGCEHFMLGRGALANPFLVCQIAKELGLPASEQQSQWGHQTGPDSATWMQLLNQLTMMSLASENVEKYALIRIKQWLSFRNLRVTTPIFHQIKRFEDLSDFQALTQDHQNIFFDQQDSSRRLDMSLSLPQ